MTIAAVDRLVLHAVILEINVESYRRREESTKAKKRGPGRPATRATKKNTDGDQEAGEPA